MKVSWDHLTVDDKKSLKRDIFKFIDFKYLASIINDKKLAFLKINTWEDPYESFVFKSTFKIDGEIIDSSILLPFVNYSYGQSWTLLPESDALWRIYSPNLTSVRIRTSAEKLYKIMLTESDDSLYCLIGDVSYMSKNEFEQFAKTLKTDKDFMTDEFHKFSYFVKRSEFEHEKEFRAIYISDYESKKKEKEILHFKINPNEWIKDIVLDPRLSDKEVDNMKKKISKLGYEGLVRRSEMYYWKPLEINLNM